MTREISIALGVPHTPWIPARVESLKRLRETLRWGEGSGELYRVFSDRAKNHEWSAALWGWGAESGASHFLTLQDDAIVAPNFWRALGAMLEACPGEVICLEVIHPAARALAAQGHRWFTTADALVGVGYVLPTALLREFLGWRAHHLKPGALEKINEDTLLALWCVCTGRKVWHPIPTILDHDTSLPSTYGNDTHDNRRSLVKWSDEDWHNVLEHNVEALEDPGFWTIDEDVVHLGRFWALPVLGLEWVKDYARDSYARAMRDTGRGEIRRLARAMREASGEAETRIMICTPTPGSGTHPEHNLSIWKLLGAEDLDLVRAGEIEQIVQRGVDVVRARSLFVRLFLESDCTHLFFVDADISFSSSVLRGMLAAGRDVVAAPYPRREGIDWKRAREHGEAAAYRYSMRFPEGFDGQLAIDPQDCVEVAGAPLGCALLSRACLERMVEHYRDSLEYDDVVGGQKHPTVALFLLPIEGRELLSEDNAFCSRWRALGGKVWLYLGPGSPVTHHGSHAYRGDLGAFGLRRVEK